MVMISFNSCLSYKVFISPLGLNNLGWQFYSLNILTMQLHCPLAWRVFAKRLPFLFIFIQYAFFEILEFSGQRKMKRVWIENKEVILSLVVNDITLSLPRHADLITNSATWQDQYTIHTINTEHTSGFSIH